MPKSSTDTPIPRALISESFRMFPAMSSMIMLSVISRSIQRPDTPLLSTALRTSAANRSWRNCTTETLTAMRGGCKPRARHAA
ncbi:hypothetical protein D3C83_23620 [compost metagenome]